MSAGIQVVSFLYSFSYGCLFALFSYYIKRKYSKRHILIRIFVDMLLLKSIRKTKNMEQQKLIDNLLGLRNFMIEFTNTKKKEIDYINFLDKYYVLAVALDVNINYPDYVKSIYDDDTIHTFDCDDFITELEDITTTFVPINRSLRS